MATIYNSQYNVLDGVDENVYHFETNQGNIVILDANDNELGTLNDYMFRGKVVESVHFKTIKVSGLYRVRNLSGLPTDIDKTNVQILTVKAIGDITNPDVINYQIIDQKGAVFNKTIVGSIESEWTNGGTSLQKTINKILNDFGNPSNLKTNNKTNVVNAINELHDKLGSLNANFNNYQEEFGAEKNHNHDERYLRVDGGSKLKSMIGVDSNGGFGFDRGNGVFDTIVKANAAGGIDVGNEKSALNLRGTQDMLYNGKKVWTEVNDGAGSGLDADLLDGLQGAQYAALNRVNTFAQQQKFNGGIDLGNSTINWENGKGKLSFGNGSLNFNYNNKSVFSISSDGTQNYSSADFIANYGGSTEAKLGFKLSSGDKGFGFVRSSTNKALRLINYNLGSSGQEIFRVHEAGESVEFANYITIGGRRLYIQETQPTGNIPFGSIWIK